MLFSRERAAVPCVVGDVDEQRRLACLPPDIGAERIFVTDVESDPLAGYLVYRRVRLAGGLARDRDRQYLADEPADDRLQRSIPYAAVSRSTSHYPEDWITRLRG